MFASKSRLALSALFFVALGAIAQAENANTGSDKESIARWVAQLDSDKYTERDQASKKLAASGIAAIEPLSLAADGESREASQRAFAILEQMLRAPLTEAKAKEVLEKLAKSDRSSVARRADLILTPPPVAANDAQIAPFIPRGQIQIGGGIQIGGAAQLMRIQQAGNAQRTIDVNANGKKIHISDSPQNGIDITVTEKVNGRMTVTAWKAKNRDELKKNHPDAEKIYARYGGGAIIGGNLQIQLQAQGAPAPAPAK